MAQATVEPVVLCELLRWERSSYDVLSLRFPALATHVDGFRKEQFDDYRKQRHRALNRGQLVRKSTLRHFHQLRQGPFKAASAQSHLSA